jgi:hypothetical protein
MTRQLIAALCALSLFLAPTIAWEASVSQNLTIAVTSGGGIQTISLSNNGTTTGLSSGTAVGTFSVTLNPISPTFSYTGTNLHLSTTGTDSGGVCNSTNGAGNGSFQIINGDTLATNGALTAGSKAICIAASEAGVPARGQAFPITVGNLIDAATLSNCSGHDGSSGNPWPDSCVQQAVGLAVDGDTVLLRAGNWAMSTDSGVTVQIAKSINLIGQGSGNTFDPYGHPNNIKGIPTGSYTRVYTTGTQYNGPANVTTAHYSGYVEFGQDAQGRGTACASNHVSKIAHIFFDGSQSTDGGDYFGTINTRACPGLTFDDILGQDWRCAAAPCPISTDLATPETQIFSFLGSNNVTVQNSVLAIPPYFINGQYGGAQTMQFQDQNFQTYQNNVFWEYYANPFYISNITFAGNQIYIYNDGLGSSRGLASFGYAGCQPAPNTCADGSTANVNLFTRNNYFHSPGEPFGMGGGVNDSPANGTVTNLQFTGNWLVADRASLATCEWHVYGGYCDSGQAASVGMQANNLSFTNNSLKATTRAILDLTGAGTAANSLGVMTCNTCTAQFNWASTPSGSNSALTDANSINPTLNSNYGWDVNSNFNTPPTVSFTLGPLGLNGVAGVVAIVNPTFTAQYGAVQWIASTSPTAPTRTDARWSSNNSGFPAPQAAVTYVPPVSLSGVNHGDTVYMWVMDSVGHVSAAASQVVP